MASSSDEQPKPPEPPAAVPPQTHAEWAASLQAYYAAAGHHPYAWPAQVRFWPFGRGEGKEVVTPGSD